MITRALGTDPDVDVDTFTVDPQAGDVFVLCSDGLTDMVGDDEIGEVLARAAGEPRRSGERARPAREQGGRPGQHHDRRVRDDRRAAAEPDERTLEQTVEQTRRRTMPSPEAKKRSGWRRFVPLLILLLAIGAAAIVLWFLVR